MAETSEPTDAMFPTLNDSQVDRLRSFGSERRANAGDLIFDQGDANHGVFVVLSGSIEIEAVANHQETPFRVVGPRMFTGEVSHLSGRRSLVRCRARETSVLLELGRTCLRRLMQTDAELGEMFLRAF